MAQYQVQLTNEHDDGSTDEIFPLNRIGDVKVGKINQGQLVLPGNSAEEMFSVTLMNIKKYLSNLNTVAAQARGVSDDTGSTSSVNLATSKAVNTLKVRIDGNDSTLAQHRKDIDSKAPIMHAVNTPSTYGGGTGSLYGHVKLSDVYANQVTNASAQYSIAASQAALYGAYSSLNAEKAPNYHAVAAETYGKSTASLFGHSKLSDAFKSSGGAAASGVGASSKALFDAWTDSDTRIKNNVTNINGKAPTNHSATTTTYGGGTAANYGHVKLSDSYADNVETTGAAANSVAASAWALYRAYNTLNSRCTTIDGAKAPNKHAVSAVATYGGGTGSLYGHVKLYDSYTASGGNSAASVAASSYALNECYKWADGKFVEMKNSVDTLNSSMTDMKTEIETNISKEIDSLKKSVADGKSLLAASISQYVTPAAETTFASLKTDMEKVFTNRYQAGRTEGQNDVTGNPNGYNLYTKAQYDANGTTNYNNGRTQGRSDVTGNPGGYSLYTKAQYDANYNSGYSAGQTNPSLKTATGTATIQSNSWTDIHTGLSSVIFIGVTKTGGKVDYIRADGASGAAYTTFEWKAVGT